MVKQKKLTVTTLDALAFAVEAYYANNKTIVRDVTTEIKVTNKQKIAMLAEQGVVTQYQELAMKIRESLNQRVFMDTLSGAKINEFLLEINSMLQQDTITSDRFGILAWAPKLYNDIVKSDESREAILEFSGVSDYIGKESKKITINFEVLSCQYLKNYDSFVHNGHDGAGNLVTFWKNKRIESGAITARVKSHKKNERYSNAKTTVLNYVKAVNEK
jgi:hypothetical protein